MLKARPLEISLPLKHLPTLALLAAAPIWAAPDLQPLDIKPGNWEITLTVRTAGHQPPRITVKRSCLDARELEKPLTLLFRGEGQGCRQSVVVATSNRQEIHVDCGGDAAAAGTIRIEAPNRESAKVSSHWSAAAGARNVRMESTATLKWLGESCDAAPPAPAAPVSPPEDANRYYRLGKEQTAAKDYWAALKSLNRAIELSPERAEFYNARGYAYLLLKSYANAVVDFSDAIRLRSGYANAYRNRAVARRHSGDEDGAAADMRQAGEIPPLK